jgi:hypothetical protein
MSTWTITATAAEDDAITYAYQQSQDPAAMVKPPPGETIAAFFDRMVHTGTLGAMGASYQAVQNAELVTMLGTIPEANRQAAKKDIEAAVVAHGGTVTLTATQYKWSKSSAPPPTAQSVEMNVSDANMATVSKLYFHYLDGGGVDRMSALMAMASGTVIRIEDPANSSIFLQVMTTAAPIQRQGANGHVEFAVKFSLSAGALAPLDGTLVDVTF